MSAPEDELVVLMSTPALTPRTNPYATLLTRSLADEPGVRPEYWSWRQALTGRYDVLHLHWPESQLRGGTRLKTVGRQLLFPLVLVRARLLRRAIVRTVHNVELPKDVSAVERRILDLGERWTVLRIRLNDDTPVRPGAPVVTIKHGHYREWFAEYPRPDTVPGRIAFFGLVRRYKAVPELLRAFAETPAPDWTLHVSGHPSTPELATALHDQAAADVRVRLVLRRISDAELVEEVGEAELVVLPYPEMHNSGAVLTALSLDRPVLVPDNPVNQRLAAEVGTRWVRTFSGPLDGDTIERTVAELREEAPDGRPHLSDRDWSRIAEQHVSAYRRALAVCRSRVRDRT